MCYEPDNFYEIDDGDYWDAEYCPGCDELVEGAELSYNGGLCDFCLEEERQRNE